MDALSPVVAIIAIILGLMVAYLGFKLFKRFVWLFGAVTIGLAFLLLGLWIGNLIGEPYLEILIPAAFATVGAILGIVLARTIARIVLAIAFAVVFWMIGIAVADALNLGGLLTLAVAMVGALFGVLLFYTAFRFMVKLGTSVLGAYLIGWGAFSLLQRWINDNVAFGISVALFVTAAITGFLFQRRVYGQEEHEGWSMREHRLIFGKAEKKREH